MIWNLVDFPAGVVPFGRESGKNIDAYDDEGDNALKMAKKVSLINLLIKHSTKDFVRLNKIHTILISFNRE